MKIKGYFCRILAVLIALAAMLLCACTSEEEATADTVEYDHGVTSLDLSGQHNPDVEELVTMTNLESLDLRNTHITVEDYEKIHAALPDCSILWSVPVDGFYNDSDSEVVTAVSFSAEAIETLKYFPNLKKVDALNCDDYEFLAQAQRQYPDVKIHYSVPMGVVDIQSDCNGLKLKKVDVEALRFALTYLPKMQDVTFTDELPTEEELQQLVQDFPDVNFHW